jgi:GMP synthase-like glutamine amidotransferase
VLAEWFAAKGFGLRVVEWWKGEVCSGVGDASGLVVLGGAMNVYQHRDHPWLVPERRCIEQAAASRVPVFGICLGAQMLADMLGARVVQNPHHEVGWWPVCFSAEARARIPGLPECLPFMHWHGDTFAVPTGTLHIGSSDACPVQGFLDPAAPILGLQFHPEINRPLLRAFCSDNQSDWPRGPWVQSRETILGAADSTLADASATLGHFLDVLFPEGKAA